MATIRLSLSFFVSLALTVGLFWSMGTLIAARTEPADLFVLPKIDFTRLVTDTETEQIVRVKPVIEKPEPPPSSPTVAATKAAAVEAGADLNTLAPNVDFTGSGGGEAGVVGGPQMAFASGSDRDAVPQVRIDPEYPMAARSRGIEGWVVVEFTVTTTGGVKNIVIVDAQPPRIFDREVLRAVQGWKYSPATRDGKPIEVRKKVKLAMEMDR